MIHYYGLPCMPETAAFQLLKARHACISFANPGQMGLAASVCQSFMLDNGAFTYWRDGVTPDWPAYYEWVWKWGRHPACDFAVMPDVIGGSEDENDALIGEWPHGAIGVPVWHINESIERFVRLCDAFPRVALGSAAEYDVSKHQRACLDRVAQAIEAVADEDGLFDTRLHGLRMLDPAIITRIPLSSGDSTNIGRNVGIDKAWHGPYAPTTPALRAVVLAERTESHETPAVMRVEPSGTQDLFDLLP